MHSFGTFPIFSHLIIMCSFFFFLIFTLNQTNKTKLLSQKDGHFGCLLFYIQGLSLVESFFGHNGKSKLSKMVLAGILDIWEEDQNRGPGAKK